MTKIPSPTSVLEEADTIINVWEANPEFKLGNIDLAQFRSSYDELKTVSATIDAKRTELTELVTSRNDKAVALRDLATRARSGFRAFYGTDSPQYGQAGGTRRSERKRRERRTNNIAVSNSDDQPTPVNRLGNIPAVS